MRFGVRRRNGVWETTSIDDASLHELHPARRTALDRILDSTSRSTLLWLSGLIVFVRSAEDQHPPDELCSVPPYEPSLSRRC